MTLIITTDWHLSPRSESRKRKHPCSLFRTNKKAYLYEIWFDFKILILSFKNHLHIFWMNSLWSVKKIFLHACLCNFQEIRGTENSGSVLVCEKLKPVLRSQTLSGRIRFKEVHLEPAHCSSSQFANSNLNKKLFVIVLSSVLLTYSRKYRTGKLPG